MKPVVGDDLGVTGRIYSVGYEGFSIDAFVDRLLGNHVTTLVDVRLNAVSRKPGFSRKRLQAALEAAGIAYRHEKALGNPPENRDSFRSGDGEDGRNAMRKILANEAADALERVVAMASVERIALLCVEREPARCHREVITDAVVHRAPHIEVIPIW